MENQDVQNCTKLDYLFQFGVHRTAFSDMAFSQAEESGGYTLMLKINGVPLGFVCVVHHGEMSRIMYAYTLPDCRRKGVCKTLVSEVIRDEQQPVVIGVSEKNEGLEAFKRIAETLGFQQGDSSVIFSIMLNDDEFSKWNNTFMVRKENSLCRLFTKEGFDCRSFSDADVFEKLLALDNESFQNMFDLRPFLLEKSRRLDRTLSFVALKDGKPCAYTLVVRADSDSVVFEQISTSAQYIGRGVIILPFIYSMAAIQETYKSEGLRQVAYTMYENNTAANAFRRHLPMSFSGTQCKNYNFVYSKKKL